MKICPNCGTDRTRETRSCPAMNRHFRSCNEMNYLKSCVRRNRPRRRPATHTKLDREFGSSYRMEARRYPD